MLAVMQTMLSTGQVSAVKVASKQGAMKAHRDGNAEAAACGTMPELLRDVVEIVAQLSRVDAALDEARRAAPSTPEAEAWREMSVAALTMSRDALLSKQSGLLQHLLLCSGFGAGGQAQQVPCERKIELDVHKPVLDVHKPVLPLHRGKPEPQASVAQAATQTAMQNEAPAHQEAPQSLKDAKEQYGVRSLRKDLEALRSLPDKRVIIVRKIKPLGFASVEALREYFRKFGPVEDVIVPHSSTRPGPRRGLGRMRPGVMGFVVMGSSEAAQAAMDLEGSHVVRDVSVEVAWFKHTGGGAGEAADPTCENDSS